MLLTTADLVTAVKRKGQIPDGSDYSDADILAEADGVISGRMTEVVAGLSNGYYIRSIDIAMVAGTSRYALPTRAMADTVEQVSVVQSDGAERFVSRLRGSDAMYVAGSSGTPYNYTVEGADILLYPTPTTASETIRVRYQLRRSRLTLIGANAFAITAINTGTFTVTFTGTIPTPWQTYNTIPAYLDFIAGSSGTPTIEIDRLVTGYTQGSPSHVESDSTALPSSLAVGDYVALAGYTPVVQLPYELHDALATATAAAILMQRGFFDAAGQLDSYASRDIHMYQRMAAQRVKKAPVPFVNRNSMLRLRGR